MRRQHTLGTCLYEAFDCSTKKPGILGDAGLCVTWSQQVSINPLIILLFFTLFVAFAVESFHQFVFFLSCCG